MPRALSLDLRVRVLAAVAQGLSHRQALRTVWGQRREREPVAGARARAGRAPGRWAETADPDGSRRTKTRSSNPRGVRRMEAEAAAGFGHARDTY
jgi:hypothetical protein